MAGSAGYAVFDTTWRTVDLVDQLFGSVCWYGIMLLNASIAQFFQVQYRVLPYASLLHVKFEYVTLNKTKRAAISGVTPEHKMPVVLMLHIWYDPSLAPHAFILSTVNDPSRAVEKRQYPCSALETAVGRDPESVTSHSVGARHVKQAGGVPKPQGGPQGGHRQGMERQMRCRPPLYRYARSSGSLIDVLMAWHTS